MEERWCSRCKRYRINEVFSANANKYDGLANYCRPCKSEYERNRRRKNPVASRRGQLRESAKKRGLDFDLSRDDLLELELPERCPVLGITIDYEAMSGRGPHDAYPSVHRINPEIGYVHGNIMVISARANRILNNATLEELTKCAEWTKAHTYS
jgi:hypothetical protein